MKNTFYGKMHTKLYSPKTALQKCRHNFACLSTILSYDVCVKKFVIFSKGLNPTFLCIFIMMPNHISSNSETAKRAGYSCVTAANNRLWSDMRLACMEAARCISSSRLVCLVIIQHIYSLFYGPALYPADVGCGSGC